MPLCAHASIVGLSPPVRGSPKRPVTLSTSSRSIPARAGEPRSRTSPRDTHWVYPRPCGGATSRARLPTHRKGLSPPVRGSLEALRRVRRDRGSIPARAGEPSPPPRLKRWKGVYPRPCGGASANNMNARRCNGLSPPVRGSPPRSFPHLLITRSIPARAGEPPVLSRLGLRCRVYPRPCGGAPCGWRPIGHVPGLSPPVRGSRCASCVAAVVIRSIPARAGEPRTRTGRGRTRVYPRPCGGAMSSARSPVGSLVYPRPCGGASSKAQRGTGLSPPVRGSPRNRNIGINRLRSIPARAGEPPPVSRRT